MSLAVLMNLGFAGSGATASTTVGAHIYAFIDSRSTFAVSAMTDTTWATGAMTDTHKLTKPLSTDRTVVLGTITDTEKVTGEIQ